MRYNFLILSIYSAFLLSSCNYDKEYFTDTYEGNVCGDVLLQERDQLMPKVESLPLNAGNTLKTRSTGPNGEIIGNSDAYLGYSYSVGNSILGDMENVKFPILDLEKVKAVGSTTITRKLLNSNSSYSFAYNGMERYEANSQITKTVKTGFSLNFLLFKIGREEKTTDLFQSSYEYGTESVYGELGIEVKNSQFELLTTAEKLKTYARQCLSSTFLTDLYRGAIGDLLNVYGPYVLRSYITGGKTLALYSGQATGLTTAEKRESGLALDMSASFSWDSKSNESGGGSASASLSFGHENGSSNGHKYNTQNTQIYIRTYGGSPSYQASVGPVELESLSLDLSAWLNSLKDSDLHTMIAVTSGTESEMCGLYPMSDFVLEKNFKYRMDDTTFGILESYNEVLYPRFEIVKVLARTTPNGEDLYEIAAVLNTRQGDKIVLSDGGYKTASDASLRENLNNQIMMNKVQEIFAQKKQIFEGLEFSTNYATKYNPNVRTPLCIRLDGFNENTMALYVDPKTNMHYIYNSSNKIALSYLDDEEYGDYVLDYYGIREWVESLPRKTISMMILQDYTIIGL